MYNLYIVIQAEAAYHTGVSSRGEGTHCASLQSPFAWSWLYGKCWLHRARSRDPRSLRELHHGSHSDCATVFCCLAMFWTGLVHVAKVVAAEEFNCCPSCVVAKSSRVLPARERLLASILEKKIYIPVLIIN